MDEFEEIKVNNGSITEDICKQIDNIEPVIKSNNPVNKKHKRTTSFAEIVREKAGELSNTTVSEYVRPKTYPRGLVNNIGIDKLKPNPDQPRKYFDTESLKELEISIKKHGIIQPILIREDDKGELFIVAGERRYQAAKNIGKDSVPCLVTDGNPAEIALVENLLREDLTAVEESEALQRMVVEHNYTHEQLAEIMGKARSTLTEILTINKLPEVIKDDCRKNPKCSKSVLIELARLNSQDEMLKEYKCFERKGVTRDEIRITKRGEPREKLDVAKSSINSLKNKLKIMQNDWTAEERQALAQELQDLVNAIQQMFGVVNNE